MLETSIRSQVPHSLFNVACGLLKYNPMNIHSVSHSFLLKPAQWTNSNIITYFVSYFAVITGQLRWTHRSEFTFFQRRAE